MPSDVVVVTLVTVSRGAEPAMISLAGIHEEIELLTVPYQ